MLAPWLDNRVRRLIHNPDKMFCSLVKPGDVVLDFGCASGTFTFDLARMVGESGRVYAVDLQQEMLDRLAKKAAGLKMPQLKLVKSGTDSISVTEKLDFALAFWVVHEVFDRENLFREINGLLKTGGKLLVAEPLFHVSKKSFEETLETAVRQGFTPVGPVSVFLSRVMVFEKK
jgi:ubiquinone/menaquinone biosynthesis C-methylase UbiE